MLKTLLAASAFAMVASSAFATGSYHDCFDKDVYMGRSDKLASDTGSGKGVADPGTTSTITFFCHDFSDTSPKPGFQFGIGDDRNPNDNK
jgi:hypothetical protein